MKKTLLTLLCIPLIFSSCQKDDENNNNGTTYIPDTYFEQRLINLGYDSELDDYVLTGNINDLQTLDISNINISDLTGIEDFKALKSLNCRSNQLTNIDLSDNTALTYLECSNNQLTSIDLSNITDLTELTCYNNQLTSIDLSDNTALNQLDFNNNQLTSIDLSNHPELYRLECRYNQLTILKISVNTEYVYYFNCSNNPNLTCVEVNNVAYAIEQLEKGGWHFDLPTPSFSTNCP